jgi:hypothetical protein
MSILPKFRAYRCEIFSEHDETRKNRMMHQYTEFVLQIPAIVAATFDEAT